MRVLFWIIVILSTLGIFGGIILIVLNYSLGVANIMYTAVAAMNVVICSTNLVGVVVSEY